MQSNFLCLKAGFFDGVNVNNSAGFGSLIFSAFYKLACMPAVFVIGKHTFFLMKFALT